MAGIRSSFVLLTILGTHAVGTSGTAAGPVGPVEGLIVIAGESVPQSPADKALRQRAEELAREASDRFTEIMKDKDTRGAAPADSGPSHRGQEDVLAPVWDWLTRASKDYQGVIIAKFKNPSGVVALVAPSGTVAAASPPAPAAAAEEPPRPALQPGWTAVVESVREWLASASRAYRTEIVKKLAQPLAPEEPGRAVAAAEPEAAPRAGEAVPAAPEAKAKAEDKARPAEARTVPGETGATSARDEEARRKADEAAEAKRKAEAEAEAALAAERKAEAEAEAKRKSEAAAEARRKAEVEAALAAKRKADAEAEVRRRAEAAAAAKRKAQAEAEEKRKAEAAAEAERQERVAAEAKRKADADAEAEAKLVAEAEAEAKRKEEEAAQAAAEAERTGGAAGDGTRIAEAPAASRAPAVAPPVKKDGAAASAPEVRKEAAPTEAKPARTEAKRTRVAEVRKGKSRKHKHRAKRHRRPAGVIARHGRRPRVYVHRYEEHGKIASRHYGRKHRARCKRVRYRAYSGRMYVVRRGDTLSGIAQRFYGRGRHYAKIYRANAGRIRNANLIYPRQRIYIP